MDPEIKEILPGSQDELLYMPVPQSRDAAGCKKHETPDDYANAA